MKYKNTLGEELKNTVAKDFFGKYDCCQSHIEMYNMLLGELHLAMKLLGEKIKPKVCEYGFLL